jgi:hypothetical protein
VIDELHNRPAEDRADDGRSLPVELSADSAPALFRGFRVWKVEAARGSPRVDYCIDPHNGACHGEHAIIVSHFHGVPPAVQVSWQSSVFLGAGGAMSFHVGLALAIVLMEQLEVRGRCNVREAMRVVELRIV